MRNFFFFLAGPAGILKEEGTYTSYATFIFYCNSGERSRKMLMKIENIDFWKIGLTLFCLMYKVCRQMFDEIILLCAYVGVKRR